MFPSRNHTVAVCWGPHGKIWLILGRREYFSYFKSYAATQATRVFPGIHETLTFNPCYRWRLLAQYDEISWGEDPRRLPRIHNIEFRLQPSSSAILNWKIKFSRELLCSRTLSYSTYSLHTYFLSLSFIIISLHSLLSSNMSMTEFRECTYLENFMEIGMSWTQSQLTSLVITHSHESRSAKRKATNYSD